MLLRGGVAAIARWPDGCQDAAGDYTFDLPGGLLAAVDQLASRLLVSTGAVLLAVHAKVIGLLAGEPAVRVGYRVGEETLPCVVELGNGSWRQLIEHAHQVESAVARHSGHPVAELADELGVSAPFFETAVDAEVAGVAPPPPDGVVLRVGFRHGALSLWCRRNLAGAAYAARIAGYHLAAIRLAGADPDAEHRRSCLLSEDELRFQAGELAGRPRDLPDRRFHQLFEERVRQHPDAVAAALGDQRLTYDELNRRANRIANLLLDRGLGGEDVVAVCAERHFDWMAAVIGVFKAGCVYLPIERHFPDVRVTAMLSRSDCRIALADRSGRRAVERALEVVPLEDIDGQEVAITNPGVPVGPEQAAYIYFTSGSTGEPKGAMCEHAGMLNHLLAKIDDLEIGPGRLVAQTAPQGFDISLWQLAAALLVGGTTVLVPQEVVLDIGRFVDELARQRVEVLQVVPAYLDLLLTELASRGRELPALRIVSVTGEALKPGLVRRWFARCPRVRLVNAYGATEASDDTTHEVLDRPPDRSRVPLGRPVAGARVHVVDENLVPVPLGAPGEIVFAGVCVGRGYVNDEQRTRLAFVDNPREPGGRLYRSGDVGRWTPEGKLEFLGRRDNQVKIRGFRIEIEEIENQLLRVPGVREAAVIVAGISPEERSLVACYSAPPALPVGSLRTALTKTLPGYMVPAHYYWLDSLPLNDNGKVDRKALASLTVDSHRAEAGMAAPDTSAERRLATAWADVLGVPVEHVGRAHHFFEQGGTSLSALRLVLLLGGRVSLADITRFPVLSDLARVLDHGAPDAAGILRRLSPARERVRATLVCFPYAGGNAVNYLPLARELGGTGLLVYAVEPPADGPREGEPDLDVAALAGLVATELAGLAVTPILLWGHSSGSAAAVETARLLRRRNHDVRRVFVGAPLPGGVIERRRSIEQTNRAGDAEIVALLGAQRGDAALAQLDHRQASLLASAYRRDSTAADRYLIRLLEDPPAPLDVPISVVLAADDRSEPDDRSAYRGWRLVSSQVELHELEDGGHYFLTSRPARVAGIVARALREDADLAVAASEPAAVTSGEAGGG